MATKNENLYCISCKRKITNLKGTTRFACPKCGKYEIIRCLQCRESASRYTCPECSFEGPN